MRLFITCFLCLMFFFFSTVVSAKIVFNSKRDGNYGIYVMEDNGSNITLLTDEFDPSFPRWSPDGKQIVFARKDNPLDDLKDQLFLMNADGTNIRRLTEPHDRSDTQPSFSPDGKSIAFYSYMKLDNQNQKLGINVLNLESGEIRQIFDRLASHPEWSPDGKHIVFSSPSVLAWPGDNIYIIQSDGDGLRELPPPPPVNDSVIDRTIPRWSPDGKQILYVENEYEWKEMNQKTFIVRKAYRYLICDRNGKTLQQLNIPKNWRCVSIDWMDDGQSVVFSAFEVELNKPQDFFNAPVPPYNIYKYRFQTGNRTRLTENQEIDVALDWISDTAHTVSPKGKKPVQWGALKSSLLVYRAAFNAFSRNLSSLLPNQR